MASPSPDQLSDNELKWGYWYVTHYTRLHKIAWWCLLMLTAGLWLYTIFGVIKHVRESRQFKLILSQQVTAPVVPPSVRAAQMAQPLLIQGVYTVPGARGSVDLVAIVENPNSQWYVPELQYEFTLDGQPVSVDKTFLLPGERRALANFKVMGASGVADIVLHPRWSRVREPAKYTAPKFTAGAVRFIPAYTPGSDRPAVPLSQAIFTLTNDAPFSWWSVPVIVVGRSGALVAAVGQVVVDKFMSEQKRLLTVSWSESLATPSSFEIFPAVDTLDPASYLK